ncbi:GrpE nucleotide exchange factor, partial [Cladochytrium replicatum]
IKEKDEQITQLQDLYRRSLAEQENLRQRTKKEIDEKAVFAIQKFSKDLLTTADNLELTLKNSPPEEVRKENKPLSDLFTGVSLTHAELLKCFKRHGIEKYEPLGEKFDPNLHQALFTGPVPGKEPGTVFEVPKTGYMIHGRVLRPADVCVVK